MRKTLLLLGMILSLFALPALGQSTNPIASQKFTISGKAVGMGAQLACADGAAMYQVATKVGIRDDNLLCSLPQTSTVSGTVPSGPMGELFLAGPQITIPNFLKNTALGSSNFTLYVTPEFGLANTSVNKTIAESIKFGMNYKPSATNATTINMFEIGYVHGSMPTGAVSATGVALYKSNWLTYSIGVNY